MTSDIDVVADVISSERRHAATKPLPPHTMPCFSLPPLDHRPNNVNNRRHQPPELHRPWWQPVVPLSHTLLTLSLSLESCSGCVCRQSKVCVCLDIIFGARVWCK
ncbi:hypothetical protein Hanom_Chr02g00144691 [Helianthus anomalus]